MISISVFNGMQTAEMVGLLPASLILSYVDYPPTLLMEVISSFETCLIFTGLHCVMSQKTEPMIHQDNFHVLCLGNL
jgi:hypothetical protein